MVTGTATAPSVVQPATEPAIGRYEMRRIVVVMAAAAALVVGLAAPAAACGGLLRRQRAGQPPRPTAPPRLYPPRPPQRLPPAARRARGPRLLRQPQPDLPGRPLRCRRRPGARPADRRRDADPHHHPHAEPVGAAAHPRPGSPAQRTDPGRRLPAHR